MLRANHQMKVKVKGKYSFFDGLIQKVNVEGSLVIYNCKVKV